MLDPPTLIIIIILVFLAGATQGLTGFGFGLVSVPIMIIFLPPIIVVPIVMVISTLLTLMILFEARRWVELRRILPLMAAAVAGMPFGTYLLKTLDISILKIVIGCVIVLFGVAFLKGYRREVKNEKLAFAPIGFISGLLNGSTALSGPPVILFFTNQGIEKQVFRANIVAFFTVLNLVTIPYFCFNGLITLPIIKYSILLLPGMIAGAVLGIKLSHKVNERVFRNIALIIVTIAGIFSIASGLRG